MFDLNPPRQTTNKAPSNQDTGDIQLQTNGTYIQYKFGVFGKWINLIAISDLKGDPGKDGKPGAKGDPGTPGQKGEQGEPGEKGATGAPGIKGDTGAPGPRGLRGEKGDQGITGKPGDPGVDGRAVELKKSDTHIQWRYVGDSLWINLIPLSDIKGEKGDKGEPGEEGERGERGVMGYSGPRGEKGEKGDPGTGGGSDTESNEVPTGDIDGVNKVFTTANNFTSDSIAVYLNGLRQTLTLHYTETGLNEITMDDAPLSGDIITVDYVKA